MKFSIKDSLSRAWELTTKNIPAVVAFFICYTVTSFISSAAVGGGDQTAFNEAVQNGSVDEMLEAYSDLVMPKTGAGFAVYIICMILNFSFWVAFLGFTTNIALGKVEKFSMAVFSVPISICGKLLGLIILRSLIVGIATCLFIIPGIYVAVRLIFSEYAVIDQNMGIIEAMKYSWRITKGSFWRLFGAAIVGGLVYLAGFAVCCVGFCFTGVMRLTFIADIYAQFKEQNA